MKNQNILVVYYSWSGVTRRVAEMLTEKTGASLYELETVHSYPAAQRDIDEMAKKELESGQLPELRQMPGNLASYDLVLAGGPVWWYTVATPLMRFLRYADLAGVKIAPFCTHLGGEGSYFADFRKQAEGASVLKGLSLFKPIRSQSAKTGEWIDQWLAGLGRM